MKSLIVFISFFILLLFANFSFAQGSEEFLIDTISTVYCEQFNPAVSSDGNNYIVVWEDNRNNPMDIHGTIINELGAVQNKIENLNYSNNRSGPSVAFADSTYLVCYLIGSIIGLR